MLWPNALRVQRNMFGATAVFIFVASTAAAQMSMPVDTPGLGSGGDLPVAIGVHTISNSGAGIATSGNNLCLLNAACVFNGSVDTFGAVQFSGVVNTGTGQPLNLGLGTEVDFSTPLPGTVTEISAPVNTNPTGPTIAMYGTGDASNTATCNPISIPCNSNLYVFRLQDSTDFAQETAIGAGCQGETTEGGNLNCIAVHADAEETGAGVANATALGGVAKLSSTGTGASARGGTFLIDNNSASTGCGPNNPSTDQGCLIGVQVVMSGAYPGGTAFQIRGSPAPVAYGLLAESGTIMSSSQCSSGSYTGQCGTWLEDQSTGVYGIDIEAAQSSAAINIAASAGNVFLNGNALSTCGVPSGCLAGSISTGSLLVGNPSGGIKGTGTINATGYYASGTVGVSCSAGTITLTTAVATNGILTHC